MNGKWCIKKLNEYRINYTYYDNDHFMTGTFTKILAIYLAIEGILEYNSKTLVLKFYLCPRGATDST